MTTTQWQYLKSRPDSWRQQLYFKGRRLRPFTIWITMQVEQMTPEEAAEDWDLPLAAVKEAIAYCEANRELLQREALEERRYLEEQGISLSLRLLIDEFTITGRGGLPPNPNEPLTGEAVITNWATLDSDVENRPDVENRSSATPATNLTKESAPTQIVEANGWVTNDLGEVFLTASAPTATLDIPWLPSSDCNAPEPES